MSRELYLVCRQDKRCVHIGTDYSFGVKLLTIGPPKDRVEGWIDDHYGHTVTLENEHQVNGDVADGALKEDE